MEIKLNNDTKLDMADWIAGAMGVSRDTAYEWMEEALRQRRTNVKDRIRSPIEPEDFGIPCEWATCAKNYATFLVAAAIRARENNADT